MRATAELLVCKVPVVTQRPDRTGVFAQYTVFVENRELVQERLKAAGIPMAVYRNAAASATGLPRPVPDQW